MVLQAGTAESRIEVRGVPRIYGDHALAPTAHRSASRQAARSSPARSRSTPQGSGQITNFTQAQRTPALARQFSASAQRGDLVKDMYLNQLKNYKAPATSKADAEQHVRKFTAPEPPKAPELPSDLAADMSAFDAQNPTIGGPKKAVKAEKTESDGMTADQYLKFLEQPLPKEEKHH
ncbi:hypothetical protein A1Q1_08250 [Trichosporon asahii var. asahii CBS 2479]|uniref:Uncharacterized protein n=1 Tax=Trichosporon asahii var. asahii (strain ATCC 90039 / CBS 2479 / JCM 2466 / KCTC 7840 / NBRC 103889/ NCYC 2677 / UAMH 7654) TaxID=1186058 RepID=J5R4S3_TRIAS|nr:hypothetical protein A1Q1_08250 [Trichosporon asahii var. asahii CBS 2479]EJT50698.1 hypothetical protein A1Q1_08250 [Trichosporon asahii var. asahii CBS 2479]